MYVTVHIPYRLLTHRAVAWLEILDLVLLDSSRINRLQVPRGGKDDLDSIESYRNEEKMAEGCFLSPYVNLFSFLFYTLLKEFRANRIISS